MKTELPTTDERAERCETCRWWEGYELEPDEKFPVGSCKRYPPVYVKCNSHHAVDNFTPAVTYNDDFCGEWAAKPEGR